MICWFCCSGRCEAKKRKKDSPSVDSIGVILPWTEGIRYVPSFSLHSLFHWSKISYYFLSQITCRTKAFYCLWPLQPPFFKASYQLRSSLEPTTLKNTVHFLCSSPCLVIGYIIIAREKKIENQNCIFLNCFFWIFYYWYPNIAELPLRRLNILLCFVT